MFSRYVFAALFILFYSTLAISDDEKTAKWLQESANTNSNDDEDDDDEDGDISFSPVSPQVNRCTTSNNLIGECVSYYLCNSDQEDVSTRKNNCPMYLQICCELKNIVYPENQTPISLQVTLDPKK